jgi:hypothetical protein
MGARGYLGAAALVSALLVPGARVAASTVVEPIARLSLEGGYDSNALYEGQGDSIGRVSPELGLRVRDHRWDLAAVYGGDWIRYQRLARDGIWNHRADLALEARPNRRLTIGAGGRAAYAFDPVGLAQMGVFRTGQDSALMVSVRGRGDYALARRVVLAATYSDRTVVFEDGTGGAMHAPTVEALWRASRRILLGGAYGVGVFQGFETDGNTLAFSHALRARARYRFTRHVEADAYAGPAFWTGPDGSALVPEIGAELRWASRWWDVRATAGHALGIGSTARPSLGDSIEFGAVRRFGRRYDLRGDGGLWRAGRAPSGGDETLGMAIAGEAGMLLGDTRVRVALGASHFERLDEPSAELRRTTVGLRLGWSLPARGR